jgi:rhodanese-related sulfurtransferase
METDFQPDLVDEGIWLGREPRSPEDWAVLAGLGVTDVVTLMTETESLDVGVHPRVAFRLAVAHGMALHRFPIPDASTSALVDRLPAVLAKVQDLVSHRRRVYLHCRHGLYRSATAAAVWLAGKSGAGARAAADEVQRVHAPCLPDEDAVRTLCGRP